MRTTITLDDRIARRLQDEMRARGASFRETLESVLLEGLDKRGAGSRGGDFCVQARPMGLKGGIDPGRLEDLDTDLDVERFQRITRELQRKNR